MRYITSDFVDDVMFSHSGPYGELCIHKQREDYKTAETAAWISTDVLFADKDY